MRSAVGPSRTEASSVASASSIVSVLGSPVVRTPVRFACRSRARGVAGLVVLAALTAGTFLSALQLGAESLAWLVPLTLMMVSPSALVRLVE